MHDAMVIQEVDEGTMRVVLNGRLDSSMIDRIEPDLKARIDESHRHVVVDLYEVGFAASLAIRMFVAIARRLHGTGRRIVLFGAQPLVREVFDHVALDDLIPIVPEVSDALALVDAVRR
ncbi:MAG: STAS domain-containing protein [Rhodocyclaceae bacterium]|nr:STAS domain-containing protein [Rhodocyclaceae bacterium]